MSYIKRGTNHGIKQHTGTRRHTALLSKEVTYRITMIRCSQGGLSRGGEEVI